MVEDNPKGKPCLECGSPLVDLYGFGGGRICSGCKSEFEWQLDKNQKPLIGSNRSDGMIRVDEASFDIERTISFIKQLAAERDNARAKVEQCRQILEGAENNMRDAESALSDAERALEVAREQFRDYLSDEGVL